MQNVKPVFVNLIEKSLPDWAHRERGLLVTLLGLTLGWTLLSVWRYYSFAYYDWDLAFFAQAMWNLSHGNVTASVLTEGHFFGNHANIIALLLIPVYKILPHPLVLVFLKILSVAAASWFLFRYAARELGRIEAWGLLTLFWLYPANLFGLLYEFDMESLGAGIAAGMFYAYYRRYWKPFLACALFLLLVKENLPLLVVMFGVHGCFARADRIRWGLVPLLLGLGGFIAMAMLVVPIFSGQGMSAPHPYAGQYAHFGRSIPEILANMASHPAEVVDLLNTPINRHWLWDSMGMFLFLPLAGLEWIFLGLPVLGMNLVSSVPQRHLIYFSYMLVLAPFVFFALTRALGYLPRFRRVLLAVFVLLTLAHINGHWALLSWRCFPYGANHGSDRDALMTRVPAGAAVVASFPFLARMTNRAGLYPLYKIYAPVYHQGGVSYQLPGKVRYALVDEDDIWYRQLLRSGEGPAVRERLQQFLDAGWRLVERRGKVALYQREVIP